MTATLSHKSRVSDSARHQAPTHLLLLLLRECSAAAYLIPHILQRISNNLWDKCVMISVWQLQEPYDWMINHRGRPGLQSSWLDDQLCGFTPRHPLLPDGGGATAGKEEDFGLNVASLGALGETRTVQLSSEIKSKRVQGKRTSIKVSM